MNNLNPMLPNMIFKGDQNKLWDGFITDLSLQMHLEKTNPKAQFIPFIHDEKIGAADINMLYCQTDQSSPYLLTEDYADSAGDACYINIDGSYGLFYLPVAEEDRLKEFGISLRAKSKQFVYKRSLIQDNFIRECAEVGLMINFSEPSPESIGPMLNQDIFDCYFNIHPFQQLFFQFTKSHGRYGIVPVEDKNLLLSSLYCDEPVFQAYLRNFMQQTFYEGVLRFCDPAFKEDVNQRIEQLQKYLERHQAWKGPFSDWQIQVIRFMESTLPYKKPLAYTKSSFIFQHPKEYGIDHWTLQLLLEKPQLFQECYNEALRETRMSIQRMTVKDRHMNIPYYINLTNEKGEYIRTSLTMNRQTNQLEYRGKGKWIEVNEAPSSAFITGKAIPFLNELRFFNKRIALPESGSKYTPACKVMVRLLRDNGIQIPEASILRIGLNFLDHLDVAKTFRLQIPPILQPFFGEQITAAQFSQTWRSVCQQIQAVLEETTHYVEDQQIRLTEKWLADPESIAIRMMEPRLQKLLRKTVQIYQQSREQKRQHPSDEAFEAFRVDRWKLNLLVDFFKQRLVQVMDGLTYLNNRPYSLSVFLMLGPSIFWELIQYVTFRDEPG